MFPGHNEFYEAFDFVQRLRNGREMRIVDLGLSGLAMLQEAADFVDRLEFRVRDMVRTSSVLELLGHC